MMSEAGIQLAAPRVSAGMSDQNNSAFSQQASSAHSGSGNGSNRRQQATAATPAATPKQRAPPKPCAACRPVRRYFRLSASHRMQTGSGTLPSRFCCLLHYGNAKQQRERPSFQRIQLRRPDR
jgi:hypothetical protein